MFIVSMCQSYSVRVRKVLWCIGNLMLWVKWASGMSFTMMDDRRPLSTCHVCQCSVKLETQHGRGHSPTTEIRYKIR